MPKASNSELLDGKALIEAKSKVDLIKRLTGLSQYLKDLEQDESERHDKNLDSVASALVHSSIMQNKDKDVRLQAACCLADIIRLFAPEAPYDEKQLERVFALFIEQLKGLEHVASPSYTRCFYLLERLSVVKAFVLLVDLSDELLVTLFQAFFQIVSPEHSNKVITHMLDVMSSCLEECTSISQPLLDSILQNLLPSAKTENAKAYSLAAALVNRSSARMQGPITQFLSDALTSTKAAQSDLKNESHSLLVELCTLAPSLLRDVMPSLELELKVEADDVRENAVKSLCRILSTSSEVDGLHRSVCTTLLSRLNDKTPSIRVTMLQSIRALYAKLNEHRNEINNHLLSRARDADEKVRKAAVTAICEIAAEYSDAIPVAAINEVELRVRDKKPAIRREAAVQLSTLYHKLSVKFDYSWSSADLAKYGTIPTTVIKGYLIPQDDQLRFAIEKALDEDFIKADASSANRISQLIDLLASLDEGGVDALNRILRDKKSLQTDFQAYLDARRKKPIDIEEVAKHLRTIAHRLSPGDSKALAALQKFEEKADSSIWKALSVLVSAKSRLSDIKSNKTMLLKRESSKNPVIEALIYRLTQTIVPIDSVTILLGKMENKAPPAPVVSFISSLSSLFPGIFAESGEQFRTMLESKDARLTDLALVLLGNVGTLLDTEAVPQLKKDLTHLCLANSDKKAKHAMRALLRIFTPADAAVADVAKKLAQLAQKERGDKGAAALAALSVLALQGAKVFAPLRASLITFLTEEALPSSHHSADYKLRALKALANSLAGTASGDEKANVAAAKAVMPVLFNVIRNAGEVTEDATTSEDAKAKLCSKAALCLLKLARHSVYETLITPRLFQLLALTTQSLSFEVRDAFITKLSKFAREVGLPSRYLSIFALYAHDPDKNLHTKARSALETSIKVRREIMKTATTSHMYYLPEHAIPHLVHLLAHRPQFGEADLKFEAVACNFLLAALTHSTENYPFLVQLIRFIKTTEDAEEPESDKHRVVCDLLLKLLQQKADRRSWSEQSPAPISLPQVLFRLPEAAAASKEEKVYLPAGYQLPDLKTTIVDEEAKVKRTPARKSEPKSAKKKSAKRLKAESESESDGEDRGESESAQRSRSPEPARKSARAKSPRTSAPAKDESDGEEQEEEEEEKSASPPPSPKAKGKRKGAAPAAAAMKKKKGQKGK